MKDTPYLKVVGEPLEMAGRGSPRDTIFGVIGMTTYDPFSRTLGGLISSTRSSGEPAPKVLKAKGLKSERHIESGGASKTTIPGSHYGQVLYPGKYMSEKGAMVS